MPTAVLFVHTFNWCGACVELKKVFNEFEEHIRSIDPKTEIRLITHAKWGQMVDQHKYINIGNIVSAPTLVLVPDTHAGPSGDPTVARVFNGKVLSQNGKSFLQMGKSYPNLPEMFKGIKEWLSVEIKNITAARVASPSSSDVPSGLPAANLAAASSSTSSPTPVKPHLETSRHQGNTNRHRTKPAQTKNKRSCKNFRLVPV